MWGWFPGQREAQTDEYEMNKAFTANRSPKSLSLSCI